jgi:aromatic ring hydroxylase
MDGVTEFTAAIAHHFVVGHFADCGTCKTGLMDVLIRGATYLSQIQKTANTSHVQDKVTEMTPSVRDFIQIFYRLFH